MSGLLQKYISTATSKAAADLIAAVEALPADKRNWSPMDKARTALDQAAECAILNGSTISILQTKSFPDSFTMEDFGKQKDALAADWDKLKETLLANTASACAAIEAVPDSELEINIPMPWGNYSVAQVMNYPFWNMSYHEGQVNYISFLAKE